MKNGSRKVRGRWHIHRDAFNFVTWFRRPKEDLMAYRFSMLWWKLRCAWCDVREALGYLFGSNGARTQSRL